MGRFEIKLQSSCDPPFANLRKNAHVRTAGAYAKADSRLT